MDGVGICSETVGSIPATAFDTAGGWDCIDEERTPKNIMTANTSVTKAATII